MSISPQVLYPLPTSHDLSHGFAFSVLVGFDEVVASVVGRVVSIHWVRPPVQTQFVGLGGLQNMLHLRSHSDVEGVVIVVVAVVGKVLPQNKSEILSQWHSSSLHISAQYFLHGCVTTSTVLVVGVRAGVVVVVFEPLAPRFTSKKAVRKKTVRITIITIAKRPTWRPPTHPRVKRRYE